MSINVPFDQIAADLQKRIVALEAREKFYRKALEEIRYMAGGNKAVKRIALEALRRYES